MTKTFEELVKEFEAEFPSENKARDPVMDWLTQQRKFSFYYPQGANNPLEEIAYGLFPKTAMAQDISADVESFEHSLEYIWESRDKDSEEAKANAQWGESLHTRARECLQKKKTDKIICALYRYDPKDFEPVLNPMKFPKYQFLKKGTRMAGTVRLHYRLFSRAPAELEVLFPKS